MICVYIQLFTLSLSLFSHFLHLSIQSNRAARHSPGSAAATREHKSRATSNQLVPDRRLHTGPRYHNTYIATLLWRPTDALARASSSHKNLLLPQARNLWRAQWGKATLTLKAETNSPPRPFNQRTGGSACWGLTRRAHLQKPVADWRSSVTRRRVSLPPQTWRAKARGKRKMKPSGTREATATDWNGKTAEEEGNRAEEETPRREGRGEGGCTMAGLWSSSWKV